MATYKPYRKVSSTEKEEIRIPYSVLVDTPNMSEYTKRASDETVTGTWTYSTAPKMDTLKNSNGNAIYHFNSSKVFFGQTTVPIALRGSLERPQYTTNGTTFQDIALKSDITDAVSPTVAEEVTIATGDWELDGVIYKQVPMNPFAVGDWTNSVFFDNTKIPDFTKFDWNSVTTDVSSGTKTIVAVAGSAYELQIICYPQGYVSNDVTFSNDNYLIRVVKTDGSNTDLIYTTKELAKSLNKMGGWDFGRTVLGYTITAVDGQDIWGEYISKDGQWQQVSVGSSTTIPPFAYRATKTIGTEMGANSVVSLGYADNPSMRECASVGVAIGEVPLASGNEITFYSVTKPTKAINLMVEISGTTTNA